MNLVTRAIPNDDYLWWIYGIGNTEWFWSRFQAGGGFYENQWLTISHRPVVAPHETAIIDLSGNTPYVDPRDADRVTFNLDGQHVILPRGVEYFDSSLNTTTEIRWLEHFGATTDGSLDKLHADVGNHDFYFTTAIKDSSLFLGAGWDTVHLIDHRDIPGEQFWSLIRRDDNSLDAYSLLTGNRVRMEGGLESRNGPEGYHNFGEVELVFLNNSRTGEGDVYNPGVDIPTGGSRGTFQNIDLRSDGQTHSDSFNLAYFNFIRYTSDNVWVGEATIHDGVNYFTTPSDRTVTEAKYGFDAPILGDDDTTYEEFLSVIGQSRNGTHDLIISERTVDEGRIDGNFRLYTGSVGSGLFNEFNEVYVGTELGEVANKSYTVEEFSELPAAGSNRIYQVGTSGTDNLFGWNGTEWLPAVVINQLRSIDYTGPTPTFDRIFTNTLHDLVEQGTAPTATPATEDQDKIVKVGSTFYEWNGSVWVTVNAGDLSDKVFLRTNGEYSVWNGTDLSEVLIVEPHHRVALYGFGGNDTLKGGAGRDYIFGGQSTYNLIDGETGNEVWGGAGADYFGVGNLNSSGDLSGANETISGSNGADFLQGYATDVIMDWHAGEDTLVVLENGVAVIGGLRDQFGLVSLSGNNIIDLRAYEAVATSDQDFDGARGGADVLLDPSDPLSSADTSPNWDETKSLDFIYQNQSIRDAQSITNVNDVTVVNHGLIVVRGLTGNDTIIGSSGNDYLYGNSGRNVIDLSAGGENRVYIDDFNPSGLFVKGFDENDTLYLNQEIVDSFASVFNRPSEANLIAGAQQVNAEYTSAVNYYAGKNFLHSTFYNRLLSDPATNAEHDDAKGNWPNADQSADSLTFGIGLGMFVTGLALRATGFLAAAGEVLIATGSALGGGSATGLLSPTTAHQNATISGRYDHYINILNNNDQPATTIVGNNYEANESTTVQFLDFFAATTTTDSFTEVLEFTDPYHVANGVFGYFAVTSTTETFVYLIASRDNLVENSEAIKIAELNGTNWTADNFMSYIGEEDIYNQVTVSAPQIATPDITEVSKPSSIIGDGSSILLGAGEEITIEVSLTGDVASGGVLKLFDGLTFIDSVELNGNETSHTFTDNRGLGTTAVNTTNNETGGDEYILQDSEINYRVELVNSNTGIITRSDRFSFSAGGGDKPIVGAETETDTLILTSTSDFVNGFASDPSTANAKISGIERILLAPGPVNAQTVDLNSGVVDSVVFSHSAVSDLSDGIYQITFINESTSGNVTTSLGSGAVGFVTIEEGEVKSVDIESGGANYTNTTQAFISPGVFLNLMHQQEGFEIIGSSGNDTIISGLGADRISGGDGRDTFKYVSATQSLSSEMDTITDFEFGGSGDVIDLDFINSKEIALSSRGFNSLIELQNYATSSTFNLVGDPDLPDLTVFVGFVANGTESGAYVLARDQGIGAWDAGKENSAIVKLEGIESLDISSDLAPNFFGSQNFYDVTYVVTTVDGATFDSSYQSDGGYRNVGNNVGDVNPITWTFSFSDEPSTVKLTNFAVEFDNKNTAGLDNSIGIGNAAGIPVGTDGFIASYLGSDSGDWEFFFRDGELIIEFDGSLKEQTAGIDLEITGSVTIEDVFGNARNFTFEDLLGHQFLLDG